MKQDKLIELLKEALPGDLNITQLIPGGIPTGAIPLQQLLDILRSCKLINWGAYKANYRDLAVANVDGTYHFCMHGIYEGRKLTAWNRICLGELLDVTPKYELALIVIHNSSEDALMRTLDSLAAVRMQSKQILVCDNCNNLSLDILKFLKNQYDAICISGPLGNVDEFLNIMQAGIDAANLVFLQSGAELKPERINAIIGHISRGYDIVAYLPPSSPATDSFPTPDASPAAVIYGRDILNHVLKYKNISFDLFSKIFPAAFFFGCLRWLRDNLSGSFGMAAIALTVLSHARTVATYKGQLCSDAGSKGIHHLEEVFFQDDLGSVSNGLKQLCDRLELNAYWDNIASILVRRAITSRLDGITNILDLLSEYSAVFGFANVFKECVELLYKKWATVATVLQKQPSYTAVSCLPTHVGIFFLHLFPGGVTTSIKRIIACFQKIGLQVTLFIATKIPDQVKLPENVNIYYVGPFGKTANENSAHSLALYNAVRKSRVDIMLYMFIHDPGLIWDLLVLKLLGVRCIGSLRTNYNYEFLLRAKEYTHNSFLQVIRCFESVFCVSQADTFYLRIQEVNAVHIPNIAPRAHKRSVNAIKQNKIAVIGRFTDPVKQPFELMYIMQKVIRVLPNAKLIFIGDFQGQKDKTDFLNKVNELNLAPHIEITGFVQDVGKYLEECKLLLSTSLIEGFPNGISEAQSYGLPIVMYDVNIDIRENNPSIFVVDQYDRKGAAELIIMLMWDDGLRDAVAPHALRQSSIYSEERFCENLQSLIFSPKASRVTAELGIDDYRKIIREMTFYLGKNDVKIY